MRKRHRTSRVEEGLSSRIGGAFLLALVGAGIGFVSALIQGTSYAAGTAGGAVIGGVAGMVVGPSAWWLLEDLW